LFDAPGVQRDDAVGQSHRFHLVMRDINHGRAEAAVQLAQFDAHRRAQLGVEVGQRFVEKKHFRFAHNRAADGGALALAAGQLARLALQQRSQVQRFGRGRDATVDVGRGQLGGHAQAERDVVAHRHVRIQRV